MSYIDSMQTALQRRAARLRQVATLRAEGLTYQEIGERIGLSTERARQLVADADREMHVKLTCGRGSINTPESFYWRERFGSLR